MAKHKKNLKRHGSAPGGDRQNLIRPRFLIVCEGKVTERAYFKYVRTLVRESLVRVEVAPDHGRDPERLVRQAIARREAAEDAARRERDVNRRYDQAWCVFDVDQHARLPAARRLASDHGILTAVSNPCFELWALLHFRDQRAHIDGKDVSTTLCSFIPGYEKRLDCAALEQQRPTATERARRLDDHHERNGSPHGNPSTGVWRLIAAIEAEARRFRDQGSGFRS